MQRSLLNASASEIIAQVREFVHSDDWEMSILANVSALINEHLNNLNWVGFYLWREGRLQLGPFQGKVACTQIESGKGVCGTSFKNAKTIRVPNVHEFPGHIACDSASNSEIVVPLFIQDKLAGVLDLDSPQFDRFTLEDQLLLENIVRELNRIKQK